MCRGSDGRPVLTEGEECRSNVGITEKCRQEAQRVAACCAFRTSGIGSDPPLSVFQTTRWRRSLEAASLARPRSPWRAAGQRPSAPCSLASESWPWRAARAPLPSWFTAKSWPSWTVSPGPGSSSTPCTQRPGPASRSPPPTCSLWLRGTAQRGRSQLQAPSRLCMPVTPERGSACWCPGATARPASPRSPGSR